MNASQFTGMYEYKGFTIWDTGEREWIAEPNWDIEQLERLKPELPRFSSIAKAKKWVREIGIDLNEDDYRK